MDVKAAQDSSLHVPEKKSRLQARFVIALAASLLNAVWYVMRMNTSVTIVAIALETDSSGPHYDWNSNQRSAVLSSFFWGYTVTQVPGIFAVRKLGPKRLVLITTLLSSVFTVLFVPAAAVGWQLACVSRICLGLVQGGLMTSVQQLLAHWAPPAERARMVVYSFCGQQVGIILAFAGSGVISDLIGWPWVYYISGILGLLLAVAWYWMVENTPAQHRWASPQERHYIEKSISAVEEEKKHLKNLKVPWRGILTSVPYWTLIFTQCANSWGAWTLLTGIPSYMSGVLGFDLSKNGVLSSLPYFAMWMTSLVLAWAADKCLKRKYWSLTTSRKIGNSIGQYGPAIALIILSFSTNNPTSAVTLLTIGVALTSGALVGLTANYIDLGYNFASVLMGISNQFGCAMGIIAPLITGVIVTDNESDSQWRIVFLITSGFLIIGNTMFLIFGTGKEQPWNNPEWSRAASSESDAENVNNETSSQTKI